jgi:hypothetical protein
LDEAEHDPAHLLGCLVDLRRGLQAQRHA